VITLIPALVLGVLGAGLLVVAVATFRRHKLVAVPIGLLGVLGVVAAVLVLVFVKAYKIPSESMVPALKIGDRVATVGIGDPAIDDILVFHPPAGAINPEGPQCGTSITEAELCTRPAGGRAKVTLVKRVVGVGGDKLRIEAGKVIRNGKPAAEAFTRPCGTGSGCDFQNEITVPRGHVYMLGDNRGASDDSRFWGAVPESWIVGKVVLRYWPLKRFGAP
jgi:signal peptidase I